MPLLTDTNETEGSTVAQSTVEPLLPSGYQALEFPDSVKFLLFFNEDYRKGVGGFALYPWQVEVNQDICYGRTRENGVITRTKTPSSLSPYKFCLCAANGSGKDAFVIAPLVLWFLCCKIQSKIIITSCSAGQLSSQTEKYIKELADLINKKSLSIFGQEIIKIRRHYYECTLSGSVMHLFATDEPERAEGHHPIAPGRDMLIVVNEAKSIPVDIHNALRRCTGFSYWIDVSSPGEPTGPFHEHWQYWPNKRRVTVFDCLKHHAMDEFEEDRRIMGEHSPLFRSKWLALFTYIGGAYVVPQDKLDRLRLRIRNGLVPELKQSEPIRVGIDIALSGNGDETVISVWRGNKQLGEHHMRQQDATVLADNIEQVLSKDYKLDTKHPHIFADDGGVGRAVIDILNNKGWNIIRILNQSALKTKSAKKQYKNRGAQLWYKFSRFIQEDLLIFSDVHNDALFSQIASRKYKQTDAGLDKLTLQSKREMMAEGFKSPDRADAAVLAFTDVSLEDYLDAEEVETPVQVILGQTIDEIKANLRLRAQKYLRDGRRSNGSLNAQITQNRRQLCYR